MGRFLEFKLIIIFLKDKHNELSNKKWINKLIHHNKFQLIEKSFYWSIGSFKILIVITKHGYWTKENQWMEWLLYQGTIISIISCSN